MKKPELNSLTSDIMYLVDRATKQDYILHETDIFCLGYMAGMSRLKTLLRDKKALLKAILKYDKNDDMHLCDTIGETLIDLGVGISSDKI